MTKCPWASATAQQTWDALQRCLFCSVSTRLEPAGKVASTLTRGSAVRGKGMVSADEDHNRVQLPDWGWTRGHGGFATSGPVPVPGQRQRACRLCPGSAHGEEVRRTASKPPLLRLHSAAVGWTCAVASPCSALRCCRCSIMLSRNSVESTTADLGASQADFAGKAAKLHDAHAGLQSNSVYMLTWSYPASALDIKLQVALDSCTSCTQLLCS